jgi:GT2 family glycosyltransferase
VSAPEDQTLPPASLIIASRNRPELLEAAVVSILQGEHVPAELIIVDQSDKPHPRLSCLRTERPCEIRYLQVDSIGLSRANNLGIAAARHDLLIFTHDDVLAPPHWFGAIVRTLTAAGPRGVVTGQVLPSEAERPGGVVPSLVVDDVAKVYEGRIGKDVLFPLNMAMHRGVIEDIGPFDERLGPGTRFPAGEDNDFGLRLLEAKYRIIYAPEAALFHRAWRSNYLRLRWCYGRGQGGYFAKHLGFRDRYMTGRMLRSLGYYFRRSLYRARHEPRSAVGDALYATGTIFGALEWFSRRILRL